ncbi:MAG: regulatory iron-sulfur-containing complex subunit RicT [Thermodesulfovibrionales bacterium]
MAEKVGVRFRPCGKMYYFEVNGDDIKKGDSVVVESSLGMTIGNVVTEKLPVGEEEKELKKVLRKTTDKDVKKKADNEELEADSKAFCLERIHARGLPMKLVCTEATLDKKRIIFYFTAEGRIDFRELVKDLAARFKTRIEMRQIGVRDETKLIGGIGICGREVCCRTFLTGFVPVSIKMAKKQELVLNTSKLSGLCGRLMCCLAYESEEDLRMAASGKEKEDIAVTDDEYKEETPGVKSGDSREPREDKKERVVTPERPGEKSKEEVERKPEVKGAEEKESEEKKEKDKEAPKAKDSEKKADDEKKRRRSRKFHRSSKRRKKKK